MIGLFIGGLDQVVSHIGHDRLGIVHQSPSLWQNRSCRRL